MSTDPPRTIVGPALAIAAALLSARVWFIAHRALDLDEFEHVHAAWSVARGLLPYRDFFEPHPPALYFLFAPLFAGARVASDPATAVRALIAARAAMWLLTIASVAVVYRLGALVRNRTSAAIAVVLLATSSQFLESMLEIRPDVPAVLCLLTAIWCITTAEERGRSLRPSVYVVGGLAYGASLLFTQKTLFAAPGLAVALMRMDRRPTRAGLFAIGALAPLAMTASWFDAEGALAPLWYDTVTITGRLNADGFSPLPRLVSNVVQQPAIYVLGIAGILAAMRPQPTSPGRHAAIVYTALSLVAGIFVIGRAYDQYYALLLPLLAVLGGALAGSLEAELSHRRVRAAAAALLFAAAELSFSNYVRNFKPIAPQIDAMSWVMQHTAPRDEYLGGSPDAALFRPHAWFYFFLTGAFAADADYRALQSALESGAMRPRLVVMDTYFQQRAPAPLLAYVGAQFRRAHGDLYLRQSEYGRSALKASDASERFDRPLTR